MENSLIYDLLLMDKLGPYREELRKVEGYFFKQKQQSQQQLEQTLNGEQLKLLNNLSEKEIRNFLAEREMAGETGNLNTERKGNFYNGTD